MRKLSSLVPAFLLLVALVTGKGLWDSKLPYTSTAVPITYQGKNGKQYVAIIAASGGPQNGAPKDSQSPIVFSLP